MMGRGRLLSGLGPVKCSLHPPGRPDSVGDISPHSVRKSATKNAQMHSAGSRLSGLSRRAHPQDTRTGPNHAGLDGAAELSQGVWSIRCVSSWIVSATCLSLSACSLL
jgi:hypothetical protein